jgi:prepilin-type N-terminal cleavage/methylation domain-containing protein
MMFGFPDRQSRSAAAYSSGFSLLELMIVCAIAVVLMTLAVPTVIATISSHEMRSSMGSLSGLFQNCRTTAIKKNRTQWLRFQVSNGRWFAYVDDATSTTDLTPSKPQVTLPAGFIKSAAPSGAGAPPALDAATLWGSGVDTSTTAATPRSDLDTYFSPLGTPCTYTGGNCATQSFAYYFRSGNSTSDTRWAAIAVSPAGRIKAVYWDGTVWGN